jgi:hypothetical protein
VVAAICGYADGHSHGPVDEVSVGSAWRLRARGACKVLMDSRGALKLVWMRASQADEHRDDDELAKASRAAAGRAPHRDDGTVSSGACHTVEFCPHANTHNSNAKKLHTLLTMSAKIEPTSLSASCKL